MKHLPKNQNIYIYKNNRIYIDFFKAGKRVRKSTGLKHSPLAVDFVRKHYEDFLYLDSIEREYGVVEARLRLKALQKKYYEIEDKEIEKSLKSLNENGFKEFDKEFDRKITKEEELEKSLREVEYSFLSVSEAFLKEKSFLKDNTCKNYKILIKHLLDFLHKNKLYYLSDFKREHSLMLYEYFQNKDLSASTIKTYCFLMKNFFNYALENEFLIKSPFFVPKTKQRLKEKKKQNFEVFSLEEAITLIKEAKGDLRTFLILAFFTGARTGELLALKWEDLDFERNEIHIYKTLSTSGKIDSPKTKSSNRSVDMLPMVKDELLSIKKEKGGVGFVVESSRFILKKFFDILLEKLHYKKRRLYDTRHSFASIMLSKGEEPLWVGCKMLGHKDLNETYKSYAKYLPKPVVQRAGFLSGLDLARA